MPLRKTSLHSLKHTSGHRSYRLRRLGSDGRGRGTFSRRRHASRPLFAGADVRRDQLQLLPAASRGNVCPLARQRARHVSLFREDPEGHYARRTPRRLRAAARRLPRIRDATGRHARLLARATAAEPRVRSRMSAETLFYIDARAHEDPRCAGGTPRKLVHEGRGHVAEVEDRSLTSMPTRNPMIASSRIARIRRSRISGCMARRRCISRRMNIPTSMPSRSPSTTGRRKRTKSGASSTTPPPATPSSTRCA